MRTRSPEPETREKSAAKKIVIARDSLPFITAVRMKASGITGRKKSPKKVPKKMMKKQIMKTAAILK